MGFIVYRSTSLVEKGSDAFNDIFLAARRHNIDANLTGYLHSEDGYFVQYLEGPTDAVEAVLSKIRRDSRHSELTILASGPMGNRRFGRWDMALAGEEFDLFKKWNKKREFSSFGQAPIELILAFFSHHDKTS